MGRCCRRCRRAIDRTSPGRQPVVQALGAAVERAARDSTRIVARTVVRKPAYRRVAILAWLLIMLMLCFHVAGELAGYVRGPGDSPRRVR